MRFFKILLLFCLSFTFMSCPNDDEPSQFRGTLVATVDGVEINFSMNTYAGLGTWEDDDLILDLLSINGILEDASNEISIGLIPFNGVGTYTLGNPSSVDDQKSYGYYNIVDENGLVTSYSTSEEHNGELIITSYQDNVVRGTFHFNALSLYDEEVITIINGSFELKVSHD